MTVHMAHTVTVTKVVVHGTVEVGHTILTLSLSLSLSLALSVLLHNHIVVVMMHVVVALKIVVGMLHTITTRCSL